MDGQRFYNTSLRQRGQPSVALNDYDVVARRAAANHGTHSAVSSKRKLQQNTSYLQLGGMINWLDAVMTILAQRFNICSSKFERRMAPTASPG